jgi:O-succinylbenzoate synthase
MLIRGESGWAEWSPFPEYPIPEAAQWLLAAHEAADHGFPEPLRTLIPVNATIPAVDPRLAHRLAVSSGCTTAKIKVAEPGQTLDEDYARVEAVRVALGPMGKIRVDANGGWSLREAITALTRLSVFDLEYAEQPCASVEELAELRRSVGVKIAADESIRKASDPYRVATLEAADLIVLKVQPLGGIQACLTLAQDLGMDVVVSSALETSIGLSAGLALAAALPRLPYACGLNTSALLGSDVVREPLVAVNGAIQIREMNVDPGFCEQYSADDDTRQFWTTRLQQCQEFLDGKEDW